MSLFRRAGAAIARIFNSSADPAAEAGKALLYAKDVTGVSQLFARASDGTVSQLTPVSSSSVFVWESGMTWAAIYAEMNAVAGPKICLVQIDPAGTARSMTNNGGTPTNLNEIYFMGLAGTGSAYVNLRIDVQAGFVLDAQSQSGGVFEVAYLHSKDIRWNFLGTDIYVPPTNNDYAEFDIDGGGIQSSDTLVTGTVSLHLRNGAFASCSDAAGMFECINTNSVAELMSQGTLGSFVFVGTIGNNVGLTMDASTFFDTTGTGSFTGGVTRSTTMRNYAVEADGTLYLISISGGGAPQATIV